MQVALKKKQYFTRQGHFTEVYSGLLCEQDQVVIKKMRVEVEDNQDVDFKVVLDAFLEGLEKLMALSNLPYFVGYIGMTLTPSVCMIMKGTSYGSLRKFLQSREEELPISHLLDANIQVASALVYMEKRNCYHGNIHCDNISVMSYDERSMEIKIGDPGLVSLYNKLPLDHPVNKKRLPWCAPELHANLSAVTAQSEVYAYCTTMWQMCSQGLNPVDHDAKLRNKSSHQIICYFADGNMLSCPQLLLWKKDDHEDTKEVKALLYALMTLCWNTDAQERPDPKKVFRELNSYAHTYDCRKKVESSSDRNDTRAQPDILTGADRSKISIAGAPEADTQVPLHGVQHTGAGSTVPSRQLGIPTAASRGHYVIDNRKLVIDWTAEIGKGHFGAVYRGKLYAIDVLKDLNPQVEPGEVVVKVLQPEMAEKYCEDFKKEVQIMQKLSHPNVVKFYGICHKGEYLVMEFVENNSLHHYVVSKRESQSITPLTFLQLSTDIATGMEYLESQRVIHCDLAARNILLTTDVRAKISDFGFSKILSQEKDYYCQTEDKSSPILWCAPECIGFKQFTGTSKSDVWSFGVVLWEMYSYGKPPVITDAADPKRIMDTLVQGGRLTKPRNCPDEVYNVMCNCWKQEDINRPDFKQLRARFILMRSAAGIAPPTPKPVEIYSRTQNSPAKETDVISVSSPTEPLHASLETGKTTDENISNLSKHMSKEMPPISQQSPEKQAQLDGMNIIKKEDLTFDCNHLLGMGQYGKVYRGIYHGQTVAVKECTELKEYARFSREFHLLNKLKDESNIVKFLGLYEQRDIGVGIQYMYVMEYLEGGSLYSFLIHKKMAGKAVDTSTKIHFLTDVAKGMNCLFQNSIVHGDLSSKNILLSKDLTAKISDFGWAKQLESSEDDVKYRRNDPSFKPQWAAPEVFHKVYTKFTDVWSFGVLCIEVFQDGTVPALLNLNPPTDSEADTLKFFRAVLDGARFPRPPQCPKIIYDAMILKCWKKEYKERMHYKDIIDALTSYAQEPEGMLNDKSG